MRSHYFKLFFSIAILYSFEGCFAIDQNSLCFDSFSKIVKSEIPLETSKWFLDEQTKKAFERTRKIVKKDVSHSLDLRYSSGSIIKAEGKKFTVLQGLGKGSEGEVYLVKAENGAKKIVKIFKRPEILIRNLEGLKKYEQTNIRTPSIELVDKKRGILVTEFMKGVTLWSLEHTAWRDLSPRVREEINKRLFNLRNEAKKHDLIPTHHSNIFLEEKTGELYVIDPF